MHSWNQYHPNPLSSLLRASAGVIPKFPEFHIDHAVSPQATDRLEDALALLTPDERRQLFKSHRFSIEIALSVLATEAAKMIGLDLLLDPLGDD